MVTSPQPHALQNKLRDPSLTALLIVQAVALFLIVPLDWLFVAYPAGETPNS